MKTMESGRLRRLCLVLALAGPSSLAAHAASPDMAAGVPARFDAAVAAGLPATLPTGANGTPEEMGATPASGDIAIRRRLKSRSTYSDGTAVELYDVRFRGLDAVALRHGASLRIASVDGRLLHSTTFKAGDEPPVEHVVPVDAPFPQGTIDEEPEHDTVDLPDNDEESRDLHVFAFVHDDVPLDDDALFERFFAWWIKRMEFDVLEDRRTHVHLRRSIPGVTDPSYGYNGALAQWVQSARRYTDPELPAPVGIKYIRNILLVKGAEVERGAAGIANRQPGSYAMASTIGSIAVPAHEIGHMLGASHDHAERRFTGPFSTCDTLMYPVDPTVPCKAYSLPNVDLIRGTMDYRRPR